MKEEEKKCPVVCQCSNKTVAICKDLKIDGFNTTKEGIFEKEIEQLDLSGNKLSSINRDTFSIWNVLNLHSFNLSGNNILNITKFIFYGFTNLENLDLSRNNISSIECGTFEFTPRMKFLRLRSNRLTEMCPHTFGPLVHLRHLDLSNNMISSIQPDTLHNDSVLEWLSLANNRLTEILPDTFGLLRHLRHLDLSNNTISSIQPDTLHNNFVLECLSLANNRLIEIDLDIFRNQKTLSYVDMSRNGITKIEGKMYHRTRNLQTFLLSSNDILENNTSASYKENELFYIDLSRNRTERLGSLTFSRNCLQSLLSRSCDNLEEKRNFSSTGNNTYGINDEAFVGLETLKYLDVSSNNVSNISLSVLHIILPQNERVTSEGTCVSEMKGLNLSNNVNHSFSFGEYFPFNLTSIILCKVELSELKGNSYIFLNLTDNARTYNCSFFQDINKTMNVTSLNCLSQGVLRTEKSNIWDLPENILIFGIYASSVFVAIIVILVITHVVGKPEPDEFWWEDKLAKVNY
jgi:Leucine-rich repeat (LRR) protein